MTTSQQSSMLSVGNLVTYAYEPRPPVTCPHCEISDASTGEPELLRGLDGATGMIDKVLDPRDAPTSVSCTGCGEEWQAPKHFGELGVLVALQDDRALFGWTRVWAFPSELSILPASLAGRSLLRVKRLWAVVRGSMGR